MGEINRRNLLALGAASIAAGLVPGCDEKRGDDRDDAKPGKKDAAGAKLPLVDYHVHLDDFGIEKTVELSQSKGIKFGVVEHAGKKVHKYPVLLSNDDDLRKYLEVLEGKPVYRGIQAEGVDWLSCFSKDLVAQLDYVLTDALTFREKDGRLVNLWKPEQVKIDDAQDFMDRYADFHVEIMAGEPIDILANGTYLPGVLQKDFAALWTEKRMRKVIDAAVKYGVAIEISGSFRLPQLGFLKLAKAAGARFSFGSNGRKTAQGQIEYSLEMARELGLKPADLFTPAPKGKKPVETRKLG
jgi:histidinol phosphatase-like PHP family hydrolase